MQRTGQLGSFNHLACSAVCTTHAHHSVTDQASLQHQAIRYRNCTVALGAHV